MAHECEDDEPEWHCQNCDFSGTPDEHENPPHLWGPVGEVSYSCPQCGEFEDPFA